MIDLTVPFVPVIMIGGEEACPWPKLPEGFRFCFWEPGREEDWCRIQVEAGQCDSQEKARRIFDGEFAPEPEKLRERMLFLLSPDGTAVGTGTAWYGTDLGKLMGRLHWLSCVPQIQGRGLGKAMFQAMLACCQEKHPGEEIYLTTQTSSYPAIHIYKGFGFRPYLGPMPANGIPWDNERAWRIINEKLAQYQKK